MQTVIIPEFLAEELKAYMESMYKLSADERIFEVVPEAVQHVMKRHADKAGVKYIRVHDLRHSSCAYLIHLGVRRHGSMPPKLYKYYSNKVIVWKKLF